MHRKMFYREDFARLLSMHRGFLKINAERKELFFLMYFLVFGFFDHQGDFGEIVV